MTSRAVLYPGEGAHLYSVTGPGPQRSASRRKGMGPHGDRVRNGLVSAADINELLALYIRADGVSLSAVDILCPQIEHGQEEMAK